MKTSSKQSIKSKKPKLEEIPDETILPELMVSIEEPPAEAPAVVKKAPRGKAKVHYVNGKEFEEEIRQFYEKDDVSDKLAISINKIANGLSYAPNFINYCADQDTEALTQRGWLNHNEISIDDTILSYNTSSKQLVWSKILDIYKEQYSGLMHRLKARGIDALVTPNHKFACEEGLKPVELLKVTDRIILTGSHLDSSKSCPYSNDFVELMGWSVTEGNYLLGKNTHAIQVFQKKGVKADRIRNCLTRLGAHFKEYEWSNPEILGFRFNGKPANDIVSLAPGRVMSADFILKLSQEQRILLIQTMIDGDGYTLTRGFRGYSQKCKKHMDMFLMLCTLAGLTTTCRLVKRKTSFGYAEYHVAYVYVKPKLTSKVENINFYGGRGTAGGVGGKENNPNTPKTPYEGIIWCPTTEYGTWVCRRNQNIYVTGNSYKEDMVSDAILKMFSALKKKKFRLDSGFSPFSYFTTIAFHAFINRIKKEKKYHETITEYKEKAYSELMQSEKNCNIYIDPLKDPDNYNEQ